jgi:hypothetical protein
MVGPTGSPIRCWEECQVQLKLSVQVFKWTFLQAEVQMAILGIDFLMANCLSVYPVGGKLVQVGTGLVLSTITLTRGSTASAIQSGLATTSPAILDVKEQEASPSPAGKQHRLLPVLSQSLVLSHRFSVTGPQLLVLSHWSSVTSHPLPVDCPLHRRFGGWLDAEKLPATKAEFMQIESDRKSGCQAALGRLLSTW